MKPIVVFVDDEANILRGLKRFTRVKRDAWTMHFFESGQEAKALIDQTAVDIVVSDMRMPEISGADLLEHISRHAPNIIRIILSGEAERAQTYRTVGRSHRFVAKPCDMDALVQTIDSLLTLRAQLGSDYAAQSISIFDELQSPPEVFDQLEKILKQETPSVSKAVEMIKKDPSLAARILQLANSAYFGRPIATCSVRRAVNAIGLGTLYDLLKLKRLGNADLQQAWGMDQRHHYQMASTLAAQTANDVERAGGDSALIDLAYATGLFAMLGAFDHGDGEPIAHRHGAYAACLLGMPDELTKTLIELPTFQASAPLSESSKIISQVLLANLADAA